MTLKRIRNKKIEPSQKHPIYLTSILDASRIQDHVQITLNTGMEEEEKEEVHLKTALTDQNVTIPIPHIESNIKTTARPIFRKPKELIKHTQDVTNHYVLSEEDVNFINNSKISIEEFYVSIEKINEENEKYIGNKDHVLTDENINTEARKYLKDRLLLLYDDNGFNSYACFRKRIIKTARKSRKLEANCVDKLKRMWNEIITLKKLYDLSVVKFQFEYDNADLENQIIKKGIEIVSTSNRNRQKKIMGRIIVKKKKDRELPFYKKYSSHEIFNDEWKLNQFKILLKQTKMTEAAIEEEANFLYKYKNKNRK
ncbi:hypothetical protein COBT_000145 [Conglomerata obtusa]